MFRKVLSYILFFYSFHCHTSFTSSIVCGILIGCKVFIYYTYPAISVDLGTVQNFNILNILRLL